MRLLLSDERLSRRLASGEAAAFDELYRRYVHRLAAYAASLLGDGAAGEDVAQVALLNAYQALRRGKVPDRVRPWLFRIAHNEAVDLLARRRELLHGIERDERPAPEDPSLARGALLEALAKLPERQRRAYVLREVHGLRVAEIAAELSLAVPQVEQALFAARNRLAEELVFPDGLTCDAARRLVGGPLASVERRALRRHFRTCDRCRAEGVTLAPGLSFDWLRGRIADVLVGGAGPVAAKATAVVAVGVAGAGVAVGPKMLSHEPHARLASLLPTPATAAAAPKRESEPHPSVALARFVETTTPAPPVVSERPVEHETETTTARESDDRAEPSEHQVVRSRRVEPEPTDTAGGGTTSGRQKDGESDSSDQQQQTTASLELTLTTSLDDGN